MTAHPLPIAPVKTPLRSVLSLDGAWDFRHESQTGWHKAPVPAPWQAAFPDLAVSFGRAVYRRRATLPAAWAGQQVVLCFGAVSDLAIVRVNGTEIARHEGGYLPFEAAIPETLLTPDIEIEVEAILPDAHRTADHTDFAEIPHGKQSWYGPQGGIWQSVRLEARARCHIRSLRLDPIWPEGRLGIALALSQTCHGSLRLEVTDPQGHPVHATTISMESDRLTHSVRLDDITAWSPDNPALYTLRAILSLGGGDTDCVAETFGFRRIEAKNGCLHLNGQPIYLRGALDQDYYPDGFGTPPSLALLEDQARKAKAMGLNCLRCHIKVPDPRYYEVADRLGLLIWSEIPNVETFSPASARRLRETMEGILARDRNHPSIVIWTLINEDWGTRLREVAEQRQWLSGMVDWLRTEDPLRLVVDNSACFPNVHVKTDINDFHYYRTATERREEWQVLCAEFAANADWTFSTDPEAVRTGKEPLIVSEFGVWGLPDPALLRGADGRDPWWMAYGGTWADGVALPRGIEARFAELGLAQVFGSFKAFIDAVQWHQWMNLKFEIEEMRRHAPIAGYVITEFTDVHWEGNGLLDQARNPRVFASAMPMANADIVLSPGVRQHAVRAGDTVHFDLTIATGGATLPEGAVLESAFAGTDRRQVLPAAGAMAVTSAPLKVALPPTLGTRRETARFRLIAPNGQVLAQNEDTLSIYAERTEPLVRFASDSDAVSARLEALGFVATSAEKADVIVTQDLDAAWVERIHAGARVLQLIDKQPGRLRDDTPPRDGPMSMQIEDHLGGMQSGAYFSFPGYQLVNRHRSIWRGDWVGNFSWLRRDGAFSHLPGGPMFDLSFSGVVPQQLMVGFRPWEFQGRVHSGVVVGWVHKPAAFLVEKRLGRGKLVATTFRLDGSAPGEDPVASALYDGLMALAVGA
jgi:Glycosyl hydrolases family 2, TIM barrel domain/Glycosyl hydrolases family 2, sugar binding domain/Glycosyl hydrolases family 2